jgi:hypothetical protein
MNQWKYGLVANSSRRFQASTAKNIATAKLMKGIDLNGCPPDNKLSLFQRRGAFPGHYYLRICVALLFHFFMQSK